MRTVLDQIWAIKFFLFLFHAFVYWVTVVLMEIFCPLRDMIFFSQYFVVYFFLLLGIYAFRGFSSIGGADVFLDCYAARFRLFRNSSGLMAPSDILILFLLYQYRYPFSISMNSSTLIPVHVLL